MHYTRTKSERNGHPPFPSFWWVSVLTLFASISCAPSTGSNQTAVEAADTQWTSALLTRNTCIKNDPLLSCTSSQAASKNFCTIAKNTKISIENVMAPFGYSQARAASAKVHLYATRIRIGSVKNESGPFTQSSEEADTQLSSELDQILAQVAAGGTSNDAATHDPESVSESIESLQADQTSTGSNACTDQRLEELAQSAPQGSVSKVFEGRNLLIWAEHIEFQDLATIPVAKSEEFSFVTPTAGVRSSEYGWRWGRMHNGLDIAAPTGTPIFAAADGTISYAGWDSGGYGYLVEMTHPGGSRTIYAHNSRNPSRHFPTGALAPGCSRIGDVGSTGNSTGPHLHFEIRMPNGSAINPGPKIDGRRC